MPEIHHYRARTTWPGRTGLGYERYDRAHSLTADPAHGQWTLSSDAVFRGRPELLNPEQLIVAAASSCQLLSFLAIAARARIDVLEYADQAEGFMSEADLPMRIGRIVLRPRIVVASRVSEQRVLHLLELAHQECYVANSLRSEIVIEPTVERRPPMEDK